jgi:hypothetical protein
VGVFSLNEKKEISGRLLNMQKSILIIEDRRIANALQSGNNEISFKEALNLPNYIEKLTPTYNFIDGLVFYSEPFEEEMNNKNELVKKQVRYKIVFNRSRTKNDMLVFKTATIVDYSALHPHIF